MVNCSIEGINPFYWCMVGENHISPSIVQVIEHVDCIIKLYLDYLVRISLFFIFPVDLKIFKEKNLNG